MGRPRAKLDTPCRNVLTHQLRSSQRVNLVGRLKETPADVREFQQNWRSGLAKLTSEGLLCGAPFEGIAQVQEN